MGRDLDLDDVVAQYPEAKRELEQLRDDLAAARALLLEARGRIWHTCGQPGTTESCLAHRIDAALAGQRREGE